MARVTVEDCIEKIPNRFDLVLTASHRARNIQKGEALSVERDNDKNPVVALREIADETIDIEKIEDKIVISLQRLKPNDEELPSQELSEPINEEENTTIIGHDEEIALEESGMQIGTKEDLDSTGFEDVEIVSADDE